VERAHDILDIVATIIKNRAKSGEEGVKRGEYQYYKLDGFSFDGEHLFIKESTRYTAIAKYIRIDFRVD
jgi:hypothetical protein